MIGDNAIKIVSENSLDKNVQLRALVNFKDLPLKKGDLPLTNPDIAYTKFVYRLKYKQSKNNAFKDKPYLLTGDIFYKSNNYIRFRDYDEFIAKSERIPELAWLRQHSNISKEMFNIARDSLGLALVISFDYVKYAREVKKNYKALTGKNFKGSVFIDPGLVDAEKERIKENQEIRKAANRVKI